MTPFHPGYWDQPLYDEAKQGSQTSDEIFLAVGKALYHWEIVEEQLSSLFEMLLFREAVAPAAVRRAFGSIESKPSKLDALEIAAEAFFHRFWPRPEISGPFLKMKLCISLASWRRNEIAHGMVRYYSEQSVIDGKVEFISKGSFLEATGYKTKQNKPLARLLDMNNPNRYRTSKYSYSADDIDNFRLKFEALFVEIHAYMVNLQPSGLDGWPGPISRVLALDEAQKNAKGTLAPDHGPSPTGAKRMRGTRRQSTEPSPEET